MVDSVAAAREVEADWDRTVVSACNLAGPAQAQCLEDRVAGYEPDPLRREATRNARNADAHLDIQAKTAQQRSIGSAARSIATSAHRNQTAAESMMNRRCDALAR